MPGIHASGGQSGDSSDPFGQNCQGCHLLWPSTWSMQGKETQALSKDELQMGATQLFPGLWTRLALPQELAARIPWLPKGLSRQNGSRCCCHATWPGLCPYTVDFKLCSRHHLTPPTESSLPLGAGVPAGLRTCSPLCPCYISHSLFLGQRSSQDVVACDAVPPSQDSPQMLGGFLGEELQLQWAGHSPVLSHWESFLLHSLGSTPCAVL